MSNQQLSKLDFLDKEATIFKHSKKRLTENSKEIQEIITSNTKTEVENVQNAINALNQKVEQIMSSEVVEQKRKLMIEDQKRMNVSIQAGAKTFFKIRKMLYEKNLPREQRIDYEKKVYQKIISKFLSQEEIDEFEKLISMAPIMLINNNRNSNELTF